MEIKYKNKELLLKLILTQSPISRIELAKRTGLTKMTVTNLIGELIAEGIVQEVGAAGSGPGRRMITLAVKPRSRLLIGVYLSRNHVRAVRGDLCGSILDSYKVRLSDETKESLLVKLLDAVAAMMPPRPAEKRKVMAIGLACIGPLDQEAGVLFNPPNFFGIKDLAVVEAVQAQYDIPVFLENDMNASALAEKYFGHAGLTSDFIYLGVSNGIGAGIVTGGRLYEGARGFSGEVGHITVDVDGRPCACGNTGCLELYASLPPEYPALPPAEQSRTLDRICPYLAAGIITMINLFDPTQIFLGHEIAHTGEEAAQKLSALIQGRYLSAAVKGVQILPSAFGPSAATSGAMALCIEHLYDIWLGAAEA